MVEKKKVCTNCNTLKPISEFFNHPKTNQRCKECVFIYNKKYNDKVECICGKMLSKNYLKKHVKTELHFRTYMSLIS